MIRVFALLLMLLPVPAISQNRLPAFFDVTGVAADDVLNLRADPGAEAALLGSLAPDASDIEVVTMSPDGNWGRVNLGEVSGWASMRYLARQPAQDWAQTGEFGIGPAALECFGTEPFWSLILSTGDEMSYSSLGDEDGEPRPGIFAPVWASASSGKRAFSARLNDRRTEFIGIINFETCSDGMSDLVYGLSVDLVRSHPMGRSLDQGCCRLSRD